MDTGHFRVKFIKCNTFASNQKIKRGVGMNKKWEVTIIELKDNGKRYKVTRRVPEMSISETKISKSKEKAIKQLQEWLS